MIHQTDRVSKNLVLGLIMQKSFYFSKKQSGLYYHSGNKKSFSSWNENAAEPQPTMASILHLDSARFISVSKPIKGGTINIRRVNQL